MCIRDRPLSDVRKDVPPRMSAIVMQCLAKDPDDRPPTAEALLTQLDMIATTSGEIRTREHKIPKKKRTVTAPVPVVEKGHTKKSRSKFLVGGIALLILATAIGILAVSYTHLTLPTILRV